MDAEDFVARITVLETALRHYTTHHTCEDSWYSCPLSEDGCANDDREGCTCGATYAIEALGGTK